MVQMSPSHAVNLISTLCELTILLWCVITGAYRVVSAQRDKRTVELRMSDIQSIQCRISDAVIDFYTR